MHVYIIIQEQVQTPTAMQTTTKTAPHTICFCFCCEIPYKSYRDTIFLHYTEKED